MERSIWFDQLILLGLAKPYVFLVLLLAPRDPDVWNGLDPNKWLYFHGVKDLTVEGGGTVDGSGREWWARSCKIKQKNISSTYVNCRNCASNFLLAAMSTCSKGDDCISIVSNSSKISIGGITYGPGHGISIGSLGKSNSSAEVHDIEVNGAILSNTTNGARIKTWQGGSGFASGITFQNLRMENVSNPIIIDQYYCDSSVPCANQTSAVSIDKISKELQPQRKQ